MPERPALSVIVIARNEATRIRRCLDALRWAEELIVVDDASTDATAEICRTYGARVVVRPMREGFGEQKAFALAQARQPWVLSIDADEVVTPALRSEIEAALAAPSPSVGYRMPRLTSYLGRPIRHCGWYPLPVLRLFRRDRARFTDALVHEEVLVDGPVGDLHADLLHASYDSLAVHAAKTRLYSGYEARMLERRSVRAGGLAFVVAAGAPARVDLRAQVRRPARLARGLARSRALHAGGLRRVRRQRAAGRADRLAAGGGALMALAGAAGAGPDPATRRGARDRRDRDRRCSLHRDRPAVPGHRQPVRSAVPSAVPDARRARALDGLATGRRPGDSWRPRSAWPLLVPAWALARDVIGRPVALLTAALLAVHPALVRNSSSVLCDSTYAFFLAAGVWLGWRALAAAHRPLLPAAGVVLGLAYLVRPEAALYLVALLLVALVLACP